LGYGFPLKRVGPVPACWSIALHLGQPDPHQSVWAILSSVTKLGDQLVSFCAGVRYWADGPEGGGHGWGFRLTVTLLHRR